MPVITRNVCYGRTSVTVITRNVFDGRTSVTVSKRNYSYGRVSVTYITFFTSKGESIVAANYVFGGHGCSD